MNLKVTVLGSSGMFATRERACAGYLVEVDGYRLLMDAGGGAWQRLLAQIDYPELDAVILSHRHPDHTIDVFQAFHARHYGQPALDPIPLWAPGETLDRICAYSNEIDQSFDLNVVKAGDSVPIAGTSFSFHEMAHPCETVGIRIESEAGTVAYSSDTGPDGNHASLASDADVFLCEATYQDSDNTWEGHMRASQAAETASRLNVRKLVLTHLPPGRDHGLSLAEAQAVADGLEVQLAADGLALEIRR